MARLLWPLRCTWYLLVWYIVGDLLVVFRVAAYSGIGGNCSGLGYRRLAYSLPAGVSLPGLESVFCDPVFSRQRPSSLLASLPPVRLLKSRRHAVRGFRFHTCGDR